MRVLVTGAAGSLGRVVTVGLAELGHDVVGLDLVPAPEGTPFAWHEADCADADAVDAVFAALSTGGRLDAVVHLAGSARGGCRCPTSSPRTSSPTAALLDAMVAHRVHRIVYASSNHAVGRTPRADGELTEHALPRPDTFYGVAKVAAEALLQLFADRHGIDAVSCRIGSFLEQPTSVRGLSTWLSHGDGVRMVEAALTDSGSRLRGALRHQRQHPRAGGTSSPAAGWATSRRTTPRTSPTRSSRVRTTRPRPRSPAARSRWRASTAPRSADRRLDLECTPSRRLVR